MRPIVEMRFGSHLYGTATPLSDLDYKGVYVPDARDILLQRVQGTISQSRPKVPGERNSASDVDRELYSLQRYLELLSEGQTVALDMLFAPDTVMIGEPGPEWREIQANSDRLVTRRAASFVRYCRQQANKYGIKGSRVAAARTALTLLSGLVDRYGTTPKLGQFDERINTALIDIEHITVVPITLGSGDTIFHLDVCGRKMPFTSSIKNARDILQRLVDEYGQRALQAESQQGVDWKALSHAVRVGTQAIELLRTGHITFPLPNAAHVFDIKLGRLPYQDVSREIEDLLVRVEEEARVSTLPDQPDYAWIEEFTASVYRREVCGGGGLRIFRSSVVGDGVALTSIEHPSGSILSKELAEESEEMHRQGCIRGDFQVEDQRRREMGIRDDLSSGSSTEEVSGRGRP